MKPLVLVSSGLALLLFALYRRVYFYTESDERMLAVLFVSIWSFWTMGSFFGTYVVKP